MWIDDGYSVIFRTSFWKIEATRKFMWQFYVYKIFNQVVISFYHCTEYFLILYGIAANNLFFQLSTDQWLKKIKGL